MAMQGAPRPAPGMKPQDYYFTLVRQGMSPYQAYLAVQANFGPPPSQQDQAKANAKNQQIAAIGGVVGTIGGAVATKYVLDNAGKWINQLTGKVATPEVTQVLRKNYTNVQPGTQVDLPTTATTGAGTGAGAGAAAGSNLPNVPGEFNYQTPEFQYGKNVEIDTPAGKQVVPETIANDSDFLSSVDWNQVSTGAITLLAAYQAYQAYKNKDYTGAAIGTAVAGTGAAALAGSELAAEAIPYAGPVLGAYGAYKTAEMIGDSAAGSQRNRQSAVGGAASGAAMGSYFGPWGTLIGGAVGGIAGLVGSWTGAHKGKAQFTRDKVRGVLQDQGILDQNYQGTLADGSKYDFGVDGKTMKWKEIDKVAAANPDSWNAVVPLTDAIGVAYGFIGQKASDMSAWYAKAAVSNANNDPLAAIANAQHFAQQQGLSYDFIKMKLDDALSKNKLNQAQYDHYLNGAQQLTAGIKSPPLDPAMVQKQQQEKVHFNSIQDMINYAKQRNQQNG